MCAPKVHAAASGDVSVFIDDQEHKGRTQGANRDAGYQTCGPPEPATKHEDARDDKAAALGARSACPRPGGDGAQARLRARPHTACCGVKDGRCPGDIRQAPTTRTQPSLAAISSERFVRTRASGAQEYRPNVHAKDVRTKVHYACVGRNSQRRPVRERRHVGKSDRV